MPASKSEQDSQLVIKFDRFSGDLRVESSGNSFKANLGKISPIAGRIPFKGEAPLRQLSKEDMEYLDTYERVCGKELAIRVKVVGSSEDEWPTGNTKSSEGSIALVQEDAIQGDNFYTATEFMLNRDIETWRLQQRVHLSGISLQGRLSTRREKLEVRTQVDTMKDEIQEIDNARTNKKSA